MHARIVAVAVVLLIVGVETGAAASAQASGGERAFRTEFTLTAPAPTIDAPLCDSAGNCIYPVSYGGTVAGDWEGTHYAGGATAPLIAANRFAASATVLFEGTIERCGTGTAVLAWRETGDLAPHTAEGTWEVVPGFGTGDLERLTGKGRGDGENVPGTRTTRARGRITCPRP